MTNKIIYTKLFLLAFLFLACKKDDIQPAPVGKPVPFAGPDKTWQQVLAASPYNSFKAAWKRSHMDTILAKNGAAWSTLFVPSDKALQDAGWSMDQINAVAPEVLDTLLTNLVSPARILPSNLDSSRGSQSVLTLGTRADLLNYSPSQPYTTWLFVARYQDSLCINGIRVSKWGTATEASNGVIYPIEKLVQRPGQSMWDYMNTDPRLSLFRDAAFISDSLYASDYRYISIVQFLQSQPGASQTTLFAPTNNAFNKHGFQTTDDIRDFILSTWPIPYPDGGPDGYYHTPITSMDTILFPHGLEMYALAAATGTGPAFFSNDLLTNASTLSGLLLVPGSAGNAPPLNLDLSFSVLNGAPMVRRLGSTAAPIGLIQKDIRVTNGVIHIVDDLFMPQP